jgi:hypothetical protein
MAEIATGDARKYLLLNPLNPDKCVGGNWRGLYAGDEIIMPRMWASPLIDAGYQVAGFMPKPSVTAPTVEITSPQQGATYWSEIGPGINVVGHSVPGDTLKFRIGLRRNGKLVGIRVVSHICDGNGVAKMGSEGGGKTEAGAYELDVFVENSIGTGASQSVSWNVVDQFEDSPGSSDLLDFA